ncbi:STM3941 family protein [Paenibacillus dakarensis]|uniref:STM3941 family protein n=1 Tax=Paenibacillus dakarensis TaxID=1527293 RepID=UPI0006D58310|nr:STM3941 family protein [Paenibacillus dakarensis]
MNNEDVIIYPRVGKLLVMSVIFVIIGALLTYAGLSSSDKDSNWIAVIGIISMIFFGFGMFYFISRMINKKPSLIVNDEGITDQSSYIEAGVIPWGEIKNIELYSYINQRMIGIQLHHPEKFMSKQKGFKKLLMRANQGLVNTPINIAESGLPISIDQLYLIIMQKWNRTKVEEQAEVDMLS